MLTVIVSGASNSGKSTVSAIIAAALAEKGFIVTELDEPGDRAILQQPGALQQRQDALRGTRVMVQPLQTQRTRPRGVTVFHHPCTCPIPGHK